MAGGVIHDGPVKARAAGEAVSSLVADAAAAVAVVASRDGGETHPAPSAETVAEWRKLAGTSLIGLRAEFGVAEGAVEAGVQAALRATLAEIDTLNGMVDAFDRLSEAQNAELVRLSGLARPLPEGRVGPGVLSVAASDVTPRRHFAFECGGCGEPVGGMEPNRLDWPGKPPGPPWRFCPSCGAALGEYPPADGRHDSVREG